MAMSRKAIIFLLLCLAPYAYVAFRWAACFSACRVDGHLVLHTLVLIFAIPFLMAIWGTVFVIKGARAAKTGVVEQRPVEAGIGAYVTKVAAAVAIVGGIGSFYMLQLWFDEPDPGRDRLGRICETSGSVTTCRPDPENRRDPLDMLNEQRRRD
ncbi:hypothetical protein OZN62_07440 [Aurantiacibacter sp. MUD11]|uniref:hypothetical protein n=1 Tax=Aurantiacibacter sp. MUD11 TaxID=3003265 RepID=UPI0022AB1AA0|nr:hypothetical protein [Aurantiacibacter sp. MUD11]WAT16778.1 hypothetical protein OZN62_07440 [Aurantiacibacter sp. MUD11]